MGSSRETIALHFCARPRGNRKLRYLLRDSPLLFLPFIPLSLYFAWSPATLSISPTPYPLAEAGRASLLATLKSGAPNATGTASPRSPCWCKTR